MAQHGNKVHLVHPDLHTQVRHIVRLHQQNFQQIRHQVVFRSCPLDHQRHECGIAIVGALIHIFGVIPGHFLISQAVTFPGIAVFIQDPAAFFQKFFGFLDAVFIVFQCLAKQSLRLSCHPQSIVEGAFCRGTPTLAVQIHNGFTVDQMGQGLADLHILGGRHVAGELELAVTGPVKHIHVQLGALVDQFLHGIDIAAVFHGIQQVNGTVFQSLFPVVFAHRADLQFCDRGLLSLEVAGIVGIDLQNSHFGSLVIAFQLVRAGSDQGQHLAGTGSHKVSVDRRGQGQIHHHRLSVLAKIGALAVIGNRVALAEPEFNIPGGSGNGAGGENIIGCIGSHRHAPAIITQQPDIRKHRRPAVIEILSLGVIAAIVASAVQRDAGSRVGKQHGKHIIPGGDRLAGIIGQILVDLQCIGQSAISVVLLLRLPGQNRHVVGVSTVPLKGQGAVIRQKAGHYRISSLLVKGLCRIAARNIPGAAGEKAGSKIAVETGQGAVNQLVILQDHRSGSHGHGGFFRCCGGCDLRRRGGDLRLVGAGSQRQHHRNAQQQGKQLLHVVSSCIRWKNPGYFHYRRPKSYFDNYFSIISQF